jgi:ribosomal protein S12 methylthiotransferase accessory factor
MQKKRLSVTRFITFSKVLPADLITLIGEKTGIVQRIFECHLERDDPEIFNCSIVQPALERLFKTQFELEFRAGAAGLTLQDAMMRAIGEAVERYAACFYDEESIVFATYRELERKGVEAIAPERFPLFSQEQYSLPGNPFKKFTKDTLIGWTEGISLTTGRRILVPAQVVYLSYTPKGKEVPIAYSTSSGCATAFSYEEALLKGAYEVIERDAVMIIWYSQIQPPKLDISSCDWLSELYRKRFRRTFIDYHFLYITLDIDIPIVMCLMLDHRSQEPVFMTGAAANLDPEQAVFKALLEAGQGRSYIKLLTIAFPNENIDPHRIYDFERNLRYYSVPENFDRYAKFLLKSKQTVKLREVPNKSSADIKLNLRIVINLLEKKNFTPIAIDHTQEDLRKIGLKVVRVLVPELVPLGVPSVPFAGNPRLYTVPKIMGYVKNVLKEKDLLHMPHPFP